MTNNQIATAFVAGKTKGKANSMFIENAGRINVIYSYGHHFPIAIKTALTVDGQTLYVFNKDKYSRTTSKQQGIVRRAIEQAGGLIQERNTEELKAIVF